MKTNLTRVSLLIAALLGTAFLSACQGGYGGGGHHHSSIKATPAVKAG
jgi:hypothetical protein